MGAGNAYLQSRDGVRGAWSDEIDRLFAGTATGRGGE